jgi:hypothetical protein
LGGTEALVGWAKKNRTEFYKLCARLIPREVSGPGDDGAHVVTIIHQHLTQAPTP